MAKILKLDNLTVGYKKPIVNNISLEVNESEIVGILGLNGSGKSTLLGGLCGLNKIYSGELYVNNVKLNNLSIKKRSRYLSYFTQRTPNLDGFLVEQIIEMGCYSKYNSYFPASNLSDKRNTVVKCAKLFKIDHLLKSEYAKLSEGQRSMVFLAKTFAQDTPVILLDEPDNNLDYLNINYLFSNLKTQIQKNKKCGLLVLHNPNLALNLCEKLVIIDKGSIAASFYIQSANTSEIQNYLRIIYPEIVIKKDIESNVFYSTFMQ